MMISKKTFVETMNLLESEDKFSNDLHKLFENSHKDFLYFDGVLEVAIIDILNEIFQKEDFLYWCCWEKKYLKTFKIGDYIDNGNNIDLSTWEKVYDYLIENKKG